MQWGHCGTQEPTPRLLLEADGQPVAPLALTRPELQAPPRHLPGVLLQRRNPLHGGLGCSSLQGSGNGPGGGGQMTSVASVWSLSGPETVKRGQMGPHVPRRR